MSLLQESVAGLTNDEARPPPGEGQYFVPGVSLSELMLLVK